MEIINLDISRKGVIPCIQAKQSEVGRKFLAVITDNGQPYIIPHDALLSVWYEGDTDAGNYSSIEEKSAFSIDGNKVTVELVAQMLLRPGNGEMCLSISHGDGGETNTWNIPYCVEYKPGAGAPVPTEYYTALTDAAARAAEQVGLAAEQVQLAKEQVSYAGASASESERQALIAEGHAESAAKSVEDANNAIMSFLDRAYPIGSIYMSAVNTSPATLFGGEWDQIRGRFLLAESDSISAGQTGGSDTHTLTIAEMPKHNHYVSDVIYGYEGWTDHAGENVLKHNYISDHTLNEIDNASSVGRFTDYIGDGSPLNTMPPYLSVYMWKRTA